MENPDETGDLQVPARVKGRFASGSSGNPKGRPAGARNRSTLVLQQLLDDAGPEVVEQLIAAAKEREPTALRLVMERVLPKRERSVDLGLVDLRSAGDLVEASSRVVRAAALGEITLPEAREFMVLLDFQRRAIETFELSARLGIVEARLAEDE